MDSREAGDVSPLAVSFGAMHIKSVAAPPGSARRLPSSHLSKRTDNKRHSWGGSAGLLGNRETTPPLIKVGSGDNGFKKIKKPRPFPLQKRSTELCLAFMTKRFTEEEAELATLCLDFAEELERRQHKDTGLRCPAPDPSAMNRRSQPQERKENEDDDGNVDGSKVPFAGLHPRTQRKKRSRYIPPPDSDLFSSSDDDEDLDGTPTNEIMPPKTFGARPMDVDIPMLDFGKLSNILSPRTGAPSSLLSPHPSPPRSPSSPGISKPDCAKYHSIQGSPRSAFVKPNSA